MVPPRTAPASMPVVSRSQLWTFLAIALPVLAALLASLPSVDLTYHLRAGAEILETGAIPNADTWTFTALGMPWIDQQWGAQLVLASVERVGGWTGLVLLRAALVGWIVTCLFVIARRSLDPRSASLLTLAAFVVAVVTLALRPQLFGMAAFATVLLLVARRREHPTMLWLVPVITLVWANLHGSFFLGPVVLGLAWLQDVHDGVPAPHRTLLVGIVSAVAACLTPFGPAVWVYAIGLSVDPLVTTRITEWQPTSLRDVPGIAFFVSALAVAAVLARRGRPTDWPTLLWFAVFFLIGTYAIRGLAWWPLAVVPALAPILASLRAPRPATDAVDAAPPPEPAGLRRLNALVAVVLGLAIVALLPVWRPVDPGLDAPAGVVGNAPPGITAALRTIAGPDDRLFNPQPWGSWFSYALPDLPIAIDSRIELYPAEVWDRYQAVSAGVDGWAEQLDDWGVTLVVIGEGQGRALLDRLLAAGWTEAHADDDGWILRTPEATT